MLKKAVDSHQDAELAKQLFPSSSPTSPPPTTRQPTSAHQSHLKFPLNSASGNSFKPSGMQSTNAARPQPRPTNASHALKRTSSGLAKAFSGNDPFKEHVYSAPGSQTYTHANKENTQLKSQISSITDAVYIDENDFDSDIDLDVEDPTGKGSISYPRLPPQTGVPSVVQYPSTTKSGPLQPRSRTSTSVDSGYDSQTATNSIDRSKFDHIKQFAYPQLGRRQSECPPPNDETIRPAKRRTLPWLQQQEDEDRVNKASQKPKTIAETFTPLPKNAKGSSYPWNTTASAVKEQQKNFKQANKNLIKTNEGTVKSLLNATDARKRQTVAKLLLSHEQKHICDLVVNKQKSVFFTGSAGTGKSVLLRQIIQELRKAFLQIRRPESLAVTASTGLAACNIGGVTLHSFAGIGLGKESVEELVKKIKKQQKAKTRWLATKVLIIDEVSMVDGELFDKLEQIARRIRNNGRPFGGIQLVITGDFFQLPPVPERNKAPKFTFDADTWNTAIEHTIGLHHVFRQKDPAFAEMLNEMRESRLSQKSIATFKSLSRELDFEDEFNATELFPRRREVDNANTSRMQQLVGEEMHFEARDGGAVTDKKTRDHLLSNCMAPEIVTLKKGAQVMLIKNMDETLVNGSIGKVIGFMNEATWDTYQKNENAFHLSQASDEDEARGVNLSRAERNSKNKVRELMNNGTQCWPVVRFAIADGTTRDVLCHRESWKVELPNGEVQASRQQVPLILAWALSIHKAQGQTLERVKVDLGNVFENGQAYVALSRATTMKGLQVLRFDPRKVFAHDRVRDFYSNLSRVEAQQEGAALAGKGNIKKGGISAGDYEEEFVDRDFEDDEEALRAYG